MIVNDSWFSPSYHQLSPTITHMVKRPKKFLIVHDSSPAVTQGASSKLFSLKTAITKWRPARQTCKSIIFSPCTKEGDSLFSSNWFVGGMNGRWIWRELVEERANKGMGQKKKGKRNVKIGGRIASGGHCRLQRNVPHEQWNIWGNIHRYRACDYQNSWPKNYHELSYACMVKREKLSSIMMTNLHEQAQ